MRSVMTVGELRKALEGIDDALPVWIKAEAISPDSDLDTLHASAIEASFAKAGSSGLFSGPPFDHFSIFADGVPEETCRTCGKSKGSGDPVCAHGYEVEGGDQ